MYDNSYDKASETEAEYELAVSSNPQHQVLYDDKTLSPPVNYASLQSDTRKQNLLEESDYLETVVDPSLEHVFEPDRHYQYIDPVSEMQKPVPPRRSLDCQGMAPALPDLGPMPTHKNVFERVDKESKTKCSTILLGISILSLVFGIAAFAIVNVAGKGSDGSTEASTSGSHASSIPAGAVLYFALGKCPDGWMPADGGTWENPPEHVAAAFENGRVPDLIHDRRFIRTASNASDVGTIEEDGTSAKNLEIHLPVKVAQFGKTSNRITYLQDDQANGLLFNTETDLSGSSTIQSTDTETRPKSIALLACVKK